MHAVPAPGSAADDKATYRNGGLSVEIVWRPASGFGTKWGEGTVVGHATLDGDPATAYSDAGLVTVVARPRGGWFVTLSGSPTMPLDELLQLAPQVRRRSM